MLVEIGCLSPHASRTHVGHAVERADTFSGKAAFGQVLVDERVGETMRKAGVRVGLGDGSAGADDHPGAERRNLRLNRLLRQNPLKICSVFKLGSLFLLIRSTNAVSA